MASEFSDDAGYYHGLTFSIKPLGDSPPVAGGTAFKLPPPPSSPRRPKRLNSEERPQSPKFDPKTAVPRPKPRKSIDSTSSSGSGILQLSTPPPGHPRTQPQPDNRAKVSEALESFEWNVGELQRTDSIESKPPPSHPPPSLLIDVDSEVSAITQRSETVSQSSDSAVDDLLGLGDPFDDSQPLSTATVADSAVKPSRPAPPAPQKVELRVPPVKSEKPLSPSRTINIDVTLTFENEDFFSTGKAPPVARPPPPKKVPPRPAPPKTRPQTIVEDEILGPLRPGGRTMDQNEEYIASLETRINQLDVEIYAIKESKVKFEEMLKVVSDENREDITGQLQECIAEIDKLTEEQSWVKGELKDLRPDPVGDLKKRNAQMRTKVVDELMQTERDYVKDIKLCYEGFIGSLKGQKFQTLLVRAKALQQEEDSKNKQNRSSMKGLELDILFGNVEQVIDVSERFLESLEENITRKPPEEQLAGLCFINFSKELEEVYSQYCRNHDDAIALLEKYEDNPDIQEYINDGLAIVRQSTNCWDLASFLIKPVQRILKYPLLLNELIKVTEEDHADKSNLLKAINTMTDVATAINEFKRRKDLVLKYRKSDSDTISNKLGKLNLHSIRKKSQRMNQRFSQVTGLVTQTIDEEFVEEERKFRDLEKTIKIFVKDVNSYLEKLQEATSEQAVLAEDIADYYANQSNLDEVAKYSKSQRDLANKLYKNYTLFVQQRVVSPLNQLLIMFQGPHKLIQKRFDKLLDYDSVLHKGEKGKSEKTKSKHKEKELDEEKDCDSPKITKYQGIREKDKEKQSKETKDERTLALKNYEALNKQLLDEMPKLYSMSVTLLKECVQSFIEAERDHFDATLKHLYPLLKLPMILDSSREDILNDFTTRNQQAIEKFLSFSFVPRNFDKKSGEKKSIKKVPSPTKQMPTQSTSQGDGQKSYVLSRYLTDQLYRVTLDYTARDSMDISVKKGDLVGVIKRQDPMGGNDKWYVDNGASQGFVPSSIMEACGDEMKDAPIASISDLSSSSHSQPDYVSEADSSSFSQQFQPEQQEPVCQYYYAEWAFEATGPNEVSLGEGEAVRVVTMNDLEGNPEWWLVEKNGQQGYVPANYLARIE
ncbi:rho guanine nucleotide exchange factor 38-like isoform X2 [Ptychodera flava]|uniref:rho guanine nucleotide exchange factor 38-like isoform X2 n=1 Tax=Ptychodera flava TaxID=63121 RepID=UPI003969F51F